MQKTIRKSGGIIQNKIGYSYDDLTTVPAVYTTINSRKECNIYDENRMLPIFTSPMLSVVNAENFHIWEDNKVNTIAPRTIPYSIRMELLNSEKWIALSLKEFKEIFCNKDNIHYDKSKTYKICIDLANGHMQSLYEAVNYSKELALKHGYKLILMSGNIANPETYDLICRQVNLDYIRLSIGSGAGCLTASNTSIHYPIATLIDECKAIKDKAEEEINNADGITSETIYKYTPKLIADGGIRNFDDINKALALGADYVMVGSLLASLLESAADVTVETEDQIKYPVYYDKTRGTIKYSKGFDATKEIYIWNGCSEEEKRELIRSVKSITKKYIGMSTKEAQIAVNAALKVPIIADKKDLKTSEGCTKFLPCKYTIAQWLENMRDYLRSAMSYTDSRTLDEFRNNTYLIVNSIGTIGYVNK